MMTTPTPESTKISESECVRLIYGEYKPIRRRFTGVCGRCKTEFSVKFLFFWTATEEFPGDSSVFCPHCRTLNVFALHGDLCE